jgi:hypothetical protein
VSIEDEGCEATLSLSSRGNTVFLDGKVPNPTVYLRWSLGASVVHVSTAESTQDTMLHACTEARKEPLTWVFWLNSDSHNRGGFKVERHKR